jgi:hypothetical protein
MANRDLERANEQAREVWDENVTMVRRKDRVLLVIANLTTHGRTDLRWLYRLLELAAIYVARLMLGLAYRRVYALTGDRASAETFVSALATLAADPQTRAVDVLLHLHGEHQILWFADRAVYLDQLQALIAGQLPELGLRGRLRLLYSTACYGAEHAVAFVDSGFRVASGAIAVNANGPWDYPVQLLFWGLGVPYRTALSAGNNRLIARIHDWVARKLRFEDVNSIKTAAGDGATRITSPAG